MSNIYDLWKTEREFWTRGPVLFPDHVLPDALVIVPPLYEPQRFESYSRRSMGAQAFDNVEFSDRAYAEREHAIVLSYCARATHPSIEGHYEANCSTVYTRVEGAWRVLSHHHVPMGTTLDYFRRLADAKSSPDPAPDSA